jgi:hypothetical protein
MNILKKIGLMAFGAAAAAFVAFGSQEASAQSQTATYSAQVTVQNAFTIGETTPLNLGTIAAISSNTAGTQAVLTLNSGTGVTSVVQGSGGSLSRILAIAPATRGQISVTNAPPSTLLTVSNPGSATYNLTNPAAPAGTPALVFTPGYTAVGFNYTTSATGALAINVGGTLATAQSANPYVDGTYTGSYQVQIAY